MRATEGLATWHRAPSMVPVELRPVPVMGPSPACTALPGRRPGLSRASFPAAPFQAPSAMSKTGFIPAGSGQS